MKEILKIWKKEWKQEKLKNCNYVKEKRVTKKQEYMDKKQILEDKNNSERNLVS